MTITSISKPTAQEIFKDIEANLDMLGQYYGLKFAISVKRYNDISISLKLEGVLTNSPKAEQITSNNYVMIGLPADCIGSKVKIAGKLYTVSNIDLKKRKFPVIIKDSFGGTYKISVDNYLRARS